MAVVTQRAFVTLTRWSNHLTGHKDRQNTQYPARAAQSFIESYRSNNFPRRIVLNMRQDNAAIGNVFGSMNSSEMFV